MLTGGNEKMRFEELFNKTIFEELYVREYNKFEIENLLHSSFIFLLSLF